MTSGLPDDASSNLSEPGTIMAAEELHRYACEARRLARLRYGMDADPEHIPSDEAHVFRLDFRGARPDKALKCEKPNMCKVAREVAVFPHLRRSGVPVPNVEATHLDVPDAAFRFLLMEFAPGMRLDLWPAGPGSGEVLYRRLGTLVARINALPLDVVPQDYAVGPWLDAWYRKEHDLCRRFLPDDARCERIIAEAEAARTASPRAFVHGGVQVLSDGDSFVIIDWGNCGVEARMRDIASFCCGLGPDQGEWRRWMLAGYEEVHPLSDQELDELRALESYGALVAAARYPHRRAERLAAAFSLHADRG
jgi:Ser/Thr protein kinase RdoA (MazF antagonist)